MGISVGGFKIICFFLPIIMLLWYNETVANRFGVVEEAAGNLRETAKMLELEIQDFNINEIVTSEQVG